MISGMKMGMICWRSRIWTMTEDTKNTSPNVKGISMAMYSGVQIEASLGPYPVTKNRMIIGTRAKQDENADSSTCDSGKHSRGKWLLAMRALFDTREFAPPPIAPPARPHANR